LNGFQWSQFSFLGFNKLHISIGQNVFVQGFTSQVRFGTEESDPLCFCPFLLLSLFLIDSLGSENIIYTWRLVRTPMGTLLNKLIKYT